jgi:hypothetical protein
MTTRRRRRSAPIAGASRLSTVQQVTTPTTSDGDSQRSNNKPTPLTYAVVVVAALFVMLAVAIKCVGIVPTVVAAVLVSFLILTALAITRPPEEPMHVALSLLEHLTRLLQRSQD